MMCMVFIRTLKYATRIKKSKISIVFDEMTADLPSNKNLNPVVTEAFIRGINLKISLVFISQSKFDLPKNLRLNSMH